MSNPLRANLIGLLAATLLQMLCFTNCNAKALFSCERHFPVDLQVESIGDCSETSTNLPENEKNMNLVLFANLLKNQNMGGSLIKLPGGKNKIVYRSANLAGAPLCINSLVKRRQVTLIMDLYAGKLGYSEQLTALEKAIFKESGGQIYTQPLDFYSVDVKPAVQRIINKEIVRIIHNIIREEGNVLVHCLTGEHDTGVIFGILQKCYNKLTPKQIEENMMCHSTKKLSTDYQKNAYKNVIGIINQFSCEWLN